MSSATDAGTRKAAPTPCTTRLATRKGTFGARPHSTEPARNTATPPRKVRRRPVRRRPAHPGPGQNPPSPPEEGAARAGPTPRPTAGDQQSAEDDRVRGDDPRQRRRAGVRVRALEVREGDVDDGQVEGGHERA